LLVSEMRTLERNLSSKKNALLNAHSGLYSSMIAGPANFPVRRMEKKIMLTIIRSMNIWNLRKRL